MKESTDDNFLGSLKGLVWTAFISVVSFQLLAPQIWSYLHDLLGISYQFAYRSFTLVYFLMAPLSLFIWFCIHRKLLIKYLPPFNKSGVLEPGSQVFIRSFPIFILWQMAVTTWGFYFHWEYFVPQTILVLYFIINIVLLWLCFQFALRFVKGSGLNEERLEKANNGVHKSYAFSLITGLLLFGAAFLFLGNWLQNRDKKENKLAASEAGRLGFELQHINDTVASRISYIESLGETDSIKRKEYALEISANSGNVRQTLKDSNAYIIRNRVLQAWGKEVSSFQKKLQLSISKLNLVQKSNFSSSDFYLAPLKLNDSTQFARGDIMFLKMLKTGLLETRQKLDKKAKFFLGIQLRSVQAKGMLMLMSIFFTTLSLYLYVNTISKAQQLLEKPEEAEIKASAFISNRLWLFLTVIAWLLIPIFKPIIDAEINVGAPFISSTAAGDVKRILSGEGSGPERGGHGKSDTSIFISTQHDTTLMLRKDTMSAAVIDSVNIIVKDIRKKVSHIENATN